ncbi:hypothetical protein SDC9_206764 [bioreactor metagenome]|uniref:Uncharacterized protein n=1 Tax=bioreactor metagenome TaxID=1076179 RepID=A0A645J6G4_9ZZZZ
MMVTSFCLNRFNDDARHTIRIHQNGFLDLHQGKIFILNGFLQIFLGNREIQMWVQNSWPVEFWEILVFSRIGSVGQTQRVTTSAVESLFEVDANITLGF